MELLKDLMETGWPPSGAANPWSRGLIDLELGGRLGFAFECAKRVCMEFSMLLTELVVICLSGHLSDIDTFIISYLHPFRILPTLLFSSSRFFLKSSDNLSIWEFRSALLLDVAILN